MQHPQKPLGTGSTVALTVLALTVMLPVAAVGMLMLGFAVLAFIAS